MKLALTVAVTTTLVVQETIALKLNRQQKKLASSMVNTTGEVKNDKPDPEKLRDAILTANVLLAKIDEKINLQTNGKQEEIDLVAECGDESEEQKQINRAQINRAVFESDSDSGSGADFDMLDFDSDSDFDSDADGDNPLPVLVLRPGQVWIKFDCPQVFG